jgi:hypothetical protein
LQVDVNFAKRIDHQTAGGLAAVMSAHPIRN